MKKLILFDFDGVLFNSKDNMKLSWQDVMKKFSIKKNFFHYKKYIGLPFKTILTKLHIRINSSKIEDYYQSRSVYYLNKIKPYPDVLQTIKNYDSNQFIIGIWTSKHKRRVDKILKRHNLNFDVILSPKKGIKGKPYPDQVRKCIKKLKIKNKNVFFVGDMKIDMLAAKNCKINFIFASYGFGKIKEKKLKKIKKFKNIFKIIN